MTAAPAKAVPILDYLLEKATDLHNQQAALHQRLNALTLDLGVLHGVVATIQGQTAADSAKLEALRTTAATSLEKLQEIGRGTVTEVKHVARDGDGNIVSVVTTKPPTGATR